MCVSLFLEARRAIQQRENSDWIKGSEPGCWLHPTLWAGGHHLHFSSYSWLSNLCSWFPLPYLALWKIPKRFGHFQISTNDLYFQILKVPGQSQWDLAGLSQFIPSPSSPIPSSNPTPDPEAETCLEESLSLLCLFLWAFPPSIHIDHLLPALWVWGREEKWQAKQQNVLLLS